jgi:hypothetical protein
MDHNKKNALNLGLILKFSRGKLLEIKSSESIRGAIERN